MEHIFVQFMLSLANVTISTYNSYLVEQSDIQKFRPNT